MSQIQKQKPMQMHCPQQQQHKKTAEQSDLALPDSPTSLDALKSNGLNPLATFRFRRVL